ncbi:MAG: hypothetical protein AB1589_25085 [Cyanobacteriota bacterium]
MIKFILLTDKEPEASANYVQANQAQASDLFKRNLNPEANKGILSQLQ